MKFVWILALATVLGMPVMAQKEDAKDAAESAGKAAKKAGKKVKKGTKKGVNKSAEKVTQLLIQIHNHLIFNQIVECFFFSD